MPAERSYGKKAVDVRPAHYGMPTLMPNTYDPARGITYFNAMIGEANYFNSRPSDPAKQLTGTGFREIFCGAHTRENAVEPVERSVRNPNCKVSHGLLGGIDTRTGDTVKKLESYYPAYSGVLGTAGDLLFMTDIMGKVAAYDKDTMQAAVEFRNRHGGRRLADDLFGQRQTICRHHHSADGSAATKARFRRPRRSGRT